MVTIAIFAIITSVVVSKNSDFNSTILLTNLAYETALTIREAQVYGLNVKKSGTGNEADFRSGFGVHFDLSNPKQFKLFSDRIVSGTNSGNKAYDNNDNTIQTFEISRGNYLYRLCLVDSGFLNNYNCLNFNQNITTANVVFTRPEPDAVIKTTPQGAPASKLEIVLASPSGSKRKVVVSTSGAISVDNCLTPNDLACR
jgi:hypothetical protein